MSNAIPMPHTESEISRALDIARCMAMSGVPVFVAAPCLKTSCSPECRRRTHDAGVHSGWHFPGNWDTVAASPAVVDSWRPGMALCAVGGHTCDFLDVDPRNGGTESAADLWRQGCWPNSYGRQITPSGGRHELIVPLHTGKGTPAPGIDVQGGRPDGTGRGFVFLAPTVRKSKVDGVDRPYRWTVEPDLSGLLKHTGETSGAGLAVLMSEHRGKPKPAESGDVSGFFREETPHGTAAADQTIMKHCGAVHDHASQGWNGFRHTLNRAAFSIGAYVGSGYLPYETAVSLLTSAIVRAGHVPDGDDRRWIETGVEDGARQPIRVVERSPLTSRTAAGGFTTHLIDAADLDEVPDPQPLVEGWLYASTTARLIGQAGAYKSFVALDLALCTATGRDWHGVRTIQTPVLYVVGEGLSGYKRRVAAWLEHNGVSRDELRGKMLITRGSVQIGGDDWSGLSEWVGEQHCRLVVVDTVARATVGSDENSSKEQGVIVEHCRQLCDTTGATLLLVHHTGHAGGEAAERGRGSSSWRAAVDTEFILTKTGDYTGALRCDRQKDAESGQTVSVHLVKAAGSLAVRIDHSAPQPTSDAREA
ncbi:MAG: AAA family ATPase, partial [Gammaproteobacteria bacterium]